MIETSMSLWESLGYNVQTMAVGLGLFMVGFVFAKITYRGNGKG